MKIKPKKIFLLDGAGALLSALFLGIVFVQFQSYIGLPKDKLYLLAVIPIGFAIYDGICYFVSPKNDHVHLRRIALMKATLLLFINRFSLLLSRTDHLTWMGIFD